MAKTQRILTPQEIKERKKADQQMAVLTADEEFAKLRPLQKKLVIEMIKDPGAPDIEQIRRAGYKVTENAKPNHVKKALEGKLGLTLRHFGIFEDDLAKIAADGLQATITKVVKLQKRDDNGKVIDEKLHYIEIPDYKTRHAYFKTLTQLGDYFPAKKVRHDGNLNVAMFGGVDPSILMQRKEELLKKQMEVTGEYEVVDA